MPEESPIAEQLREFLREYKRGVDDLITSSDSHFQVPEPPPEAADLARDLLDDSRYRDSQPLADFAKHPRFASAEALYRELRRIRDKG